MTSKETMTKDIQENSGTKIGKFIVINAKDIKGVRSNLEKILSYSKSGGNNSTIQIAYDNGTASKFDFGTSEAADDFLAILDKHCL